MSIIIKVNNLNVSFINSSRVLHAIDDISFDVLKGEFLAIVGPSGSGKTTILNCLAGLLKPTGGRVTSCQTTMVFQDSLLLPWRTAYQNITFGLEMRGIDPKNLENKISHTLSMLGLSDFKKFYPHQLSGGLKQRVNIARAYVCNPEVLLLDEPFSHLDLPTRERLQIELRSIFQKDNKTFIFVTHNIDEAILLSDRILVLNSRPGTIKATVNTNLGQKRSLDTKNTLRFKKIKTQIEKLVKP